MLHALHAWFVPAALDRAVLLANHVLAGEEMAIQRLRPHAGRVVRVQAQGWPELLPPWPPVDLRLTAAGLLERAGEGASAFGEPDLHLGVDASNPAGLAWRLAMGERPAVQVQGDAALAADVDWVVSHVRWDLAADLERVLGPGPAQAMTVFASSLARALREAVQAWSPVRSAEGAPPPDPDPGRTGPANRPEGMR
jgi:ubiquinone biosynthesis protein UbiJ